MREKRPRRVETHKKFKYHNIKPRGSPVSCECGQWIAIRRGDKVYIKGPSCGKQNRIDLDLLP